MDITDENETSDTKQLEVFIMKKENFVIAPPINY